MATFEALQQTLLELNKVNGVSMVDVLALPAPLDSAIKRLLKETLSLDKLAEQIQLPVHQTQELLDILVIKGFLTTEEQTSIGGKFYKVYFARMRKHNLPANLFDNE